MNENHSKTVPEEIRPWPIGFRCALFAQALVAMLTATVMIGHNLLGSMRVPSEGLIAMAALNAATLLWLIVAWRRPH
jgi:hypothetical protein